MKSVQISFFVLVLTIFRVRNSRCDSPLVLDYYKETCPHLEEMVQRIVEIAVLEDPRMAASMLRLHFHDCFVMGCDASVLLDDFGNVISEKEAGPNLNSLRGFEVIDEIKYVVEESCPATVSCADIITIAARDSVVLRGGPGWDVLLGRRDSLTASFNGANQFIPAPNSTLDSLIVNFQQQGLDTGDLVALSGSHTLGKARCLSFRQRIYDYNSEEKYGYHERDEEYLSALRSLCPRSGRDNTLAPLDLKTPARFDNHYFINIIEGRGLLISDNVLVDQGLQWEIRKHVFAYASNQEYFFDSFVNSMIKMGNVNVLTGNKGEIRKNCRFVNSYTI
ncbi:peroxidase 20 [Coffea eugenioides]|uniref:peroxidase 20 n=1 Tax=Coffea eugenioides TaxID=49369 RepID=UPI000F60EAC0|nr:peroxidase 20 [Coffea eugenioides]